MSMRVRYELLTVPRTHVWGALASGPTGAGLPPMAFQAQLQQGYYIYSDVRWLGYDHVITVCRQPCIDHYACPVMSCLCFELWIKIQSCGSAALCLFRTTYQNCEALRIIALVLPHVLHTKALRGEM